MLAEKLSGSVPATTYVDDVFSTFTYTGNNAAQTITNGIDLAGRGGMVWIKQRNSAAFHNLYDTVRGVGQWMSSHQTNAQANNGVSMPTYGASGFGLLTDNGNQYVNANGSPYASFTFRRAAKFFDVVTWTGNGTSPRTLAHGLGQSVGTIIFKRTDSPDSWYVWHRSLPDNSGNPHFLLLNSSAAPDTGGGAFGTPTASDFIVRGAGNTTSATYVAYLFAHDASADGLIQCGTFTGSGAVPVDVNLGWEPQFLLTKRTDSGSTNWQMFDVQRGMSMSGQQALYPNLTNAEASSPVGNPTATGFRWTDIPVGAVTYVYLAIRRSNKPPTTGTQVYNAIAYTGDGTNNRKITGVGFAPDYLMSIWRSGGSHYQYDRLRGAAVDLDVGNVESSVACLNSFDMDGITVSWPSNGRTNQSAGTYSAQFLKRAVGVFSILCDTGTGASHTVAHELGVAPEMVIRCGRSTQNNYVVWHSALAATEKIEFWNANSTALAKSTDATVWNSTAPTSTTISVGTSATTNTNAATYLTLLFATKAGISKVGSYTGNGGTQTINCGFTTGARFVLIKRTDAAGGWTSFDYARGIVAGNDPWQTLERGTTETTTDDSIDPDTSGFIVNQVAATNINVNAASYIFLAYS